MDDCKPRLTYFRGRGRAEIIRIALNALEIEYEEVYIETTERFVQVLTGGKCLFKQVPLLEHDGKCTIGSDVILRSICRKWNLLGETEDEIVRINELFMGARDMMVSCYDHLYLASSEQRAAVVNRTLTQSKERYLPVFEKLLAEGTSGFLVGNSLTMADIGFFDSATLIYDNPDLKATMDDFPRCRAFIEHLSSLPGMVRYLASERRFPPPGPDYVTNLQKLRPTKKQE